MLETRSLAKPETENVDRIWSFRQEIVRSQFTHALSGTPKVIDGCLISEPRNAWMQLTSEFVNLKVALHRGGHVLYFGSASDVMSPLVDFPLASHIHLLDEWNSGMDGRPITELKEIEERIRALSPNAKVEVKDEGFISQFSVEQLADAKQFRRRLVEIKSAGIVVRPRVIEVAWVSPALGFMVKTFHLHCLNYNSEVDFSKFIKSVPSELYFTGALVKGGQNPRPSSLRALSRRFTNLGEIAFAGAIIGSNLTFDESSFPGFQLVYSSHDTSEFPFVFGEGTPEAFKERQRKSYRRDSAYLVLTERLP